MVTESRSCEIKQKENTALSRVEVRTESIERLLKIIGDAEVMDGSHIPPEKVKGVRFTENTVLLYGDIEDGCVSYYTENVWKFLEKAMQEYLG